MFGKSSRYRKVTDTIASDANGRSLIAKTARPLPETTGVFQHTIEEGDRLDHLAYKYYKNPAKWWRICDANPEFMSPEGLIGKEPLTAAHFPLAFTGEGEPLWCDLIKNLLTQIGVESVQIIDEIQLAPQEKECDGEMVIVQAEHFDRAVIIAYNKMNVSKETLIKLIEMTGFQPGNPTEMERVGKNIIIPPNAVG